MSPVNSVFFKNASIVRPEFFFISGFAGISHTEYYYVFLCFVYVLTLLGNTFVMFMIYTDHCLHSPKFIVVFNLALSDLCASTTLVPQLIDTFLFKSNLISFEGCFTHTFFIFWFITMESLTLTLMSYDRYVAVCFPLRYNKIVTKRSMLVTIATSWAFTALVILLPVVFISRLSFCRSIVINSYFCDAGLIFRLACSDNTPFYVLNWTHPLVILWFPVIFITVTYISIARALSKIAAASERLKAMRTCTSHLILVGMFYLPMCVTYALGSIIHQNARIISTSLGTVLPAMLNPIIYSLKTEEFTESFKRFYKRNKNQTTAGKKMNKCFNQK